MPELTTTPDVRPNILLIATDLPLELATAEMATEPRSVPRIAGA